MITQPRIKSNIESIEAVQWNEYQPSRYQLIVQSLNYLNHLGIWSRRGLLVVSDILILFIMIEIGILLRFDFSISGKEFYTYAAATSITIGIGIASFYLSGVYRSIIRYSNFQILGVTTKGIVVAQIISLLLVDYLHIEDLPKSVRIMSSILTLLGIYSSRSMITWVLRKLDNRIFVKNYSEFGRTRSGYLKKKQEKKVAIYGAGTAGFLLSQMISHHEEYEIVAFLDDSKLRQGRRLNGHLIHDPITLKKMASIGKVNTVLLAVPSAHPHQRQSILNFLNQIPVIVKTIPSIEELISGKSLINDVRDIDISDLLGRDEILPDPDLLTADITDKSILVTGAGGSIGSELCRQILEQSPRCIVLYEINEYALYSIDLELSEKYPNIQRVMCLGSVTDQERIQSIIRQYQVNTIYHAAAYKHVPIVEETPSQGVINNVYGTLVAAQAAIAENVETFVLISTDKAVRPTNVMGASKRVAELVIQALSTQTKSTRLMMVRFGNVLDSSGSVVPRFRKQIAERQPITVTHQDITRYFMSIPEAARLVVQAGAMGKGGEVFLLDMGEPIRIYDLAKQMIHLSGLKIGEDIDIHITGLRPGEKLYEELLINKDLSRKTSHPKIYAANEKMIAWHDLKRILDNLFFAARSEDIDLVFDILVDLVPEYTPSSRRKLVMNSRK
jgi:FlaA1/EpsC-like NDP-sugar epimerase